MPPSEYEAGKLAAAKQQDVILKIFESMPGRSFTPAEVMQIYVNWTGKQILLTSVRRSISNLTAAGDLTKQVLTRRAGMFGISNCTWRLAVKEGEQLQLPITN